MKIGYFYKTLYIGVTRVKCITQFYILNYIEVDDLLHKSEDDIGSLHTVEIEYIIKKLISKIIQFAINLNISDRLSVYICSDHGSTKANHETNKIVEKKYYKKESENIFHRFVIIPNEILDKLPAHVEENCFLVKKDEFGVAENYLIAKGYNLFIDDNKTYYTHGGLSPEETIIPLVLFKKTKERLKDLKLRLLEGKFKFLVKSSIKLEIRNTNDYMISNLRATIRNSNIEYDNIFIDALQPNSLEVIEIPAVFKKSIDKSETEFIYFHIVYEYLGEEYSQDLEIPITIKSMIEGQEDKDIF